MTRRVLDEVDERLLAMLEKDARISVVALAKIVGLSRSAVQARIRRLEGEGLIASYTIVRGFERRQPGAKSLFLLNLGTDGQAIRRFKDWPEVIGIWSVAGSDLDAVILVETTDTEALGEFRDRLSRVHGTIKITAAPVLRTWLQLSRRFEPERESARLVALG